MKTKKSILKEAFRVIKKGGHIYCSEPDDQFLTMHPKKSSFRSFDSTKISSQGGNVFVARKLAYMDT